MSIAHDKTYNKTCATSDYSDQLAHLSGLIRVFADRACLLGVVGCGEGVVYLTSPGRPTDIGL